MADKKVYVPKQHVKRGVAGYFGANVVVVDAKTGDEKPATTKSSKKGR